MKRAFRARAEAQGRIAYAAVLATSTVAVLLIVAMGTRYAALAHALDELGLGGPIVPSAFASILVIGIAWRSQSVHEARADLFAGPAQRVDKTTPAQFTVRSAPRAVHLALDVQDGRPVYVSRTRDSDLQSAVVADRLVLVRGHARTGLSRFIYEAVLKAAPKAKLYVVAAPSKAMPNPLGGLLDTLIPMREYALHGGVLLINDLDKQLASGSASLKDLDRFLECHPRMRIVATLSGDVESHAEDDGPDDIRPLLRAHQPIVLPSELRGPELDDARRLYPGVPEEHRHRLPQYLLDAVDLTDRFDRGASTNPVGHAIVRAAIDWTRCGCTHPVPGWFLRKTVSQYLPARLQAKVDEGFFSALQWAQDSVNGGEGLIEPADYPETGHRPFALLVEQVEAEGAPIKLKIWGPIVERVDDANELILIGLAARDHGQPKIADRAWRRAEKLGDKTQQATAARHLSAYIHAGGTEAGQEHVPQQLARIGHRGTLSRLWELGPAAVAQDDEPCAPPEDGETATFDSRIPRVTDSGRGVQLYRRRTARFMARTAVLGLLDAVGICLAYAVVALVGSIADGYSPLHELQAAGPAFALYAIAIGAPALAVVGLYRDDAQRADPVRLTLALATAAAVAGTLGAFHGEDILAITTTWAAFALAIPTCGAARHIYDRKGRAWVIKRGLQRRVLLIGSRHTSRPIADELAKSCRRPMTFVGYLSDTIHDGSSDRLGGWTDLERVVERYQVHQVIITSAWNDPETVLGIRDRLMLCDVLLDTTLTSAQIQAYNQASSPGATMALHRVRTVTLGAGEHAVKRSFDILVAVTALIALAVPVALLLLLVRCCSQGPVIVRSYRPGLGGHVFPMFKIRTQHAVPRHRVLGGGDTDWKPGDSTRIGALLRRFAIDELPQLVNVVRGEMSLVGPRPIPISHYPEMTDLHRRRYFVAPGITGLWQIKHGLVGKDYNLLVEQDLNYITTWSFCGDLEILLRTIPAVLRQRHRQ